MKKFEYAYKGNSSASRFIVIFINFFYCIGTSIIVAVLTSIIGILFSQKVENNIAGKILFWIIVAFNIFQFGLFIKEALAKKNCIINENGIIIKRGSYYPHYGFNDYILYSDVVSCEYHPTKFNFYGSHCCYAILFWVCDYNNVVKITDNKGKEYYVPLIEHEKFVKMVNERINKDN